MISPTSASAGSSIVVTGTNFTGTTEVSFASGANSATASTFVVNSDTQITVTVPVQGTLPNQVDVFVTTSAGTSAQSAADQFTFAQAQTDPGQIQFASSTQTANETDAVVAISVSRTNGSDGTVSVDYSTSDGTGKAGVDFAAASGTVTFGPGEASKIIDVTLFDAGKSSGTSTFHIT